MTAALRAWAADLLHFWFHELGPDDWFGPAPWVDAALDGASAAGSPRCATGLQTSS